MLQSKCYQNRNLICIWLLFSVIFSCQNRIRPDYEHLMVPLFSLTFSYQYYSFMIIIMVRNFVYILQSLDYCVKVNQNLMVWTIDQLAGLPDRNVCFCILEIWHGDMKEISNVESSIIYPWSATSIDMIMNLIDRNETALFETFDSCKFRIQLRKWWW
jgi:hypothetical protein